MPAHAAITGTSASRAASWPSAASHATTAAATAATVAATAVAHSRATRSAGMRAW